MEISSKMPASETGKIEFRKVKSEKSLDWEFGAE